MTEYSLIFDWTIILIAISMFAFYLNAKDKKICWIIWLGADICWLFYAIFILKLVSFIIADMVWITIEVYAIIKWIKEKKCLKKKQ